MPTNEVITTLTFASVPYGIISGRGWCVVRGGVRLHWQFSARRSTHVISSVTRRTSGKLASSGLLTSPTSAQPANDAQYPKVTRRDPRTKYASGQVYDSIDGDRLTDDLKCQALTRLIRKHRMRSNKNLAAAILGLVIVGAAFAAAAQTQQSESAVQSAVREARDGIQRANPSASTPTSTGSSTPMPPRPEVRSDPSACPQKDRQNCRK